MIAAAAYSRFRAGALEAAQGMAEQLLKGGDPAAAASACATGLWVDRLHDPLAVGVQ